MVTNTIEPGPPTPDSTQAHVARLQAQIVGLNTVIKALVRLTGQPQATTPYTVVHALTKPQLEEATHYQLTINEYPATEMQPEPFLLITLTGA